MPTELDIAGRKIGPDHPTYFIADIAANHDGYLQRALDLISMARDAGADAAKFQHFRAAHIVSDRGFRSLGVQQSHQATWKKSVFEVYNGASLDWGWSPTLAEHCRKVGIHFLSSPYDFGAVDHLDQYLPAFKVGSGDITWPGILDHIARKGKPVILATGASDISEVIAAVRVVQVTNPHIALLQCNTNYTGDLENMRHVNLNVLKTYTVLFPDLVLGLSDHTPGHVAVLGAVALGARVVEKHFTDDAQREGPDHHFSMTVATWREMVDRTRELEACLGGTIKCVEDNEKQTVVLQRRCLRAARALRAGAIIVNSDVEALRPAPVDSIPPAEIARVLGKKTRRDLGLGENLSWRDIE